MNTAATNKSNVVLAIDNYSPNKKELQKESERIFSVDLSDFKCGEFGEIKKYFTDANGTHVVKMQQTKDKKGYVPGICKINRAQVEILRFMSSKTADYVYLNVSYGPSSRIVSMPISALSNLTKATDDNKSYVDASGDISKSFGLILKDVVAVASKNNLIKNSTGHELTGWPTSDGGVHVRPGMSDDRYIGNLPIVVNKMGSFDIWRDAVNAVIHDQPQAQLLLSFAPGSYLRGLSGFSTDNSNIINFCSIAESSTGKTTMLKMIQSIQTEFKIKDASTTLARSEDFMTANNHGFQCFDELQSLLGKEPNKVERLMLICNGGGRDKKTKNASIADLREWNSTIFFTGNLSIEGLLNSHSQKTALLARTLEFNCSTKSASPIFTKTTDEKISVRLSKLDSVLAENYGVAYEKIIDFINTNKDALAAEFADFVNAAIKNQDDDVDSGEYARKVKSLALAKCGATILKGIDVAVDIDEVTNRLNALLADYLRKVTTDKRNLDQHVQNDLQAIYQMLKTKIEVKGHLALSDIDINNPVYQKIAATEHNKRVTGGFMLLDQKTQMEAVNTPSGCLYIRHQGADEIKKVTGIDLQSLVARANAANLLVRTKTDIKNNDLLTLKYGYGRAYCFNLSDVPF